MSKRLNKRQQRELEELEALKAAQHDVSGVQDEDDGEDEVEEEDQSGPSNPFAALGGGQEEEAVEEDEDDEPEETAVAPKKSKKKKNKKKKSTAATPSEPLADLTEPSSATPSKGAKKKPAAKEDTSPQDEMDDLDRALAELKVKYGEDTSASAGPSRTGHPASSSSLAFRQLLSVDPKNLDADAELRRFFGSKVIASSAPTSGNKHRGAGPSSKLRYTISKPKPQYPPATSLAGLGMRDMTEEEVDDMHERRGWGEEDAGERWYTFEHSGAWREVERQFLGAVRSHDPNQLMALLQVYPWHVDTLLQMSEVYRLQSDIGAASDYAERALYAFDRCLIPSFSVSSGASRLDFDRVENRPMLTALHRIISYLGRRGCWVTAFNFAKLLFSLDPYGDPHGAALWLDFLAIKSGNRQWLLSMLELKDVPATKLLHAYPGMAYAKALALREGEASSKSKDHTASDAALKEAFQAFPQVIVPLFDKLSASLPATARQHGLLQVQAGHTDSPTTVQHLLSHIYVARSEALWKEPEHVAWLEAQLPSAMASINSPQAQMLRADGLATIQFPRDPIDEMLNVPLHICRHVLCSESTAWVGFLPPQITSRPLHAYDPLPPSTSITAYDAEYFNGVTSRSRGGRGIAGEMGGGEGLRAQGMLNQMLATIMDGGDWRTRLNTLWADFMGRREYQVIPQGQRDEVLMQIVQLGEQMAHERAEAEQRGDVMPGGFGQEREDDVI